MAGRKSRGSKKRQSRAAPQKKLEGKNGAQPPKGAKPPKGKVKRAGTETEWLATLLHNEEALTNDLRRELLQKEQALVNAMVSNGKLQARILTLEIEAKEEAMKSLRTDYSIELGATIHKDDDTGEVYFLEDEGKASKPKAEEVEKPEEGDASDEDEELPEGPAEERAEEPTEELAETAGAPE